MDYFWIQQDTRYVNPPMIENFSRTYRREDFVPEQAYKIPKNNVVFAPTDKEQDDIDLLNQQVFLVGEKVWNVFTMYESNLPYRQFTIINNLCNRSGSYYAPILESTACLSAKSRLNDDKSHVFELVLKQDAVEEKTILKVAELNTEVVVVRLDVAESMLRRNVKGIVFTKVRVE